MGKGERGFTQGFADAAADGFGDGPDEEGCLLLYEAENQGHDERRHG